MALGTEYDLVIHRGDDRQITGVIVDSNGNTVDITGAALTYVITALDDAATVTQPKGSAPTALVTKTVGSGIVLTDAANGAIRIDLGPGDTSGRKAPDDYYHELQIVLGGFTTTVMWGKFTLRRDAIT